MAIASVQKRFQFLGLFVDRDEFNFQFLHLGHAKVLAKHVNLLLSFLEQLALLSVELFVTQSEWVLEILLKR